MNSNVCMKNYSFIVPHKNCPALLKRCLESIPDRNDIEIIIVDDNSDKDKIPYICKKNARLIKLGLYESKGAGHARNIGLEAATGKWILFADCDDFYEKSFMDELDKYVNSSYDFIVFDAYWAINLQTGVVQRDFYRNILNEYLKDPNNTMKQNKVKHSNNACWNKMISHAYLQRINAKFEEVQACNDGWFVQYIGINTSNIGVINKKLYYYVLNPGSITNKKSPLPIQIQKLRTNGKIHRYLEENGIWYCVPPFYQGLRSTYKKYGFFITIYLYLLKLIFDIPWYKRLIHKFIKTLK